MSGWSEDDISAFKEAVSDLNVNVITFGDADSLISVLNNGIDGERYNDKITDFSVFSHGYIGSIAFGHSHSNASALKFTINHIGQLDANAFDNTLSM